MVRHRLIGIGKRDRAKHGDPYLGRRCVGHVAPAYRAVLRGKDAVPVCQGPGPTLSGSRLQPKISLESGTGQQLNARASSYLRGLSAWNRRVFGQAELIAWDRPNDQLAPIAGLS